MKLYDTLYYTSKLNKSKMKESKTIRYGLFFSTSLLFLFLLFYFWIISISLSVNSERNVSTLSVSNDYLINDKDFEETIKIQEKWINIDTLYNGFDIVKTCYPSINIDNNEYEYTENLVNNNNLNFNLFYEYFDGDYYLESEREYLKKNGYGDVFISGKTFSNNKKEIMVSDAFLNSLGINDYEKVIGKKITCNISFNVDYDLKYGRTRNKFMVNNGNEYDDITDELINYKYALFKDFVIVGVFNSKLFLCPSRTGDRGFSEIGNICFWIKNDDITPLVYRNEKEKSYDGSYVNVSSKYIFDKDPRITLNELDGICFWWNEESLSSVNINRNIIQFKNVEDTFDFYISNNLNIGYYRSLRAFFDFYPYYSTCKTLIFFLIICSLLISFLNVIRIIDYSLLKSKDYNIMLKNNGLKNRDIYGLYYFRVCYEFVKASIMLFIVAIPLCVMHYIGFVYVFSHNYIGTINFEISIWGYFIIYLSIIIGMLLILSFIVGLIFVVNKSKIKGVVEND